ncbi:CDC27 protein [Ciborinia camelliae]|nr:CDC27 protein [Ciborinia camelliae]
MADFKSYLAVSILTEDKVVTYRLLSRVLKVHVNAAKEMLFEFHRVQNAKKPGTIHATYLIGGTKRKEAPVAIEVPKDGEDDYMQSSPFVGSSMPEPEEGPGEGSILSITLTREEDLDKIRSEYEHISSIHIYSLGPNPLKELQLLSDSTREIQTLSKSEDPLETYQKYGIITNPNAKRRTRKAPPPIADAASVSVPTRPAAAKSKLNEVQEAPKSSSTSSKKPEPKSQPSNAKDFFGSKGKEKAKPKPQAESTKAESTNAPSSKESTPAPPANLKRQSSSIFKAFAKTQPKKAKTEEADSSVKEDTPMKDVSDDDDEDTWMPAPVSKETKDKERQSRKATQERLRKMMEDDEEEEEEEEAAPAPAPETPAEEPEEEKEVEEVKEEEPIVSTSNGRRRGRRRVMKKRTVKDEDGYLVTKQEQAWESFSEDEPPPAPKVKAPISTSSKSKKDAPKKGQGNIMSFFGKK